MTPIFEARVILSDLAKYSMTRSITQPLCDSGACKKRLGRKNVVFTVQQVASYFTKRGSCVFYLPPVTLCGAQITPERDN